MTKDTRILFDQDFYLLQAVLTSKKFKRMFDKFILEMDSKGLPFPVGGFKTAKEYHEWSNQAHAKDIHHEEFIDSVIKKFNLNIDHKDKFQLGLQWYLYFGQKKAPIRPTHTKQIGISKDKQVVEVSLTIFPWTIKEDVVDGLWKKIEIEQEKLVHYKGGKRNREFDTFERDFKIYEHYLILEKRKTKSIYKALIDSNEFNQILEIYKAGKSIDESLGPIITKYKLLLGSIDLV